MGGITPVWRVSTSHGFHGARRPDQVADHRLDEDRGSELGQPRRKPRLTSPGLHLIVQARAGPMGVDVVHVVEIDAGFLQRPRMARPLAGRGRAWYGGGLKAGTQPQDLRIDRLNPLPGPFQFFQHHHASALAQDKAVGVPREGP